MARWCAVVPRSLPVIRAHSAPLKRGLASCCNASVVDKVGNRRSYAMGVGSGRRCTKNPSFSPFFGQAGFAQKAALHKNPDRATRYCSFENSYLRKLCCRETFCAKLLCFKGDKGAFCAQIRVAQNLGILFRFLCKAYNACTKAIFCTTPLRAGWLVH